MEQLALTIGILGASFLILYFTFSWDKDEHIFLRLLGSFFFIWVLLLVPKTSLDFKQSCDFVVNQSTTNTTTGITNYTYDFICADKTYNTPVIFYSSIIRFLYIFIAYIFVYVIYVLFLKNNIKFQKMLEKLRKKK